MGRGVGWRGGRGEGAATVSGHSGPIIGWLYQAIMVVLTFVYQRQKELKFAFHLFPSVPRQAQSLQAYGICLIEQTAKKSNQPEHTVNQ